MRFDATHHSLAPPVVDHSLGCFSAGAVVAVKGSGGQIDVKLRAIRGNLCLKAVKHGLRQTTGIIRGLDHNRRHRTDKHSFRYPTFAVTGDVSRHFSTTGRMTDMDGV